MKINVTNGMGLVTIGMSDIGSYFSVRRPVSVVWHDCRGSVGKYCALLPYEKEAQQEVKERIQSGLETDFTGKEEELYVVLEPLFRLFQNGTYSLNFYHNRGKEFFSYQSSSDNYSTTRYAEQEVVFAGLADKNNLLTVEKEHRQFLKDVTKDQSRYPSDILDYTTTGIYPGFYSLIATQPFAEIDPERVRYFEERIRQGERPFALVLTGSFDAGEYDFDAANYILDGHHKLLAYQNLKKCPPLCVIHYMPEKQAEIGFDAEQLAESLYPWQTEHLLEKWDEKAAYLDEKLLNPESPLHAFVKNGTVKEYHSRRRLKSEAFYINGRIEGVYKEWYEDGAPKTISEYKNGRRVGTWKSCYPSGNLNYEQQFDDLGRYHGAVTTFFDTGVRSGETIYVHGKMADGLAKREWFPEGSLKSEIRCLDNRIIEIKRWNVRGLLEMHQVLDSVTNQLVTIAADSGSHRHREAQGERNREEHRQPKRRRTPRERWDLIKLILFLLGAIAALTARSLH